MSSQPSSWTHLSFSSTLIKVTLYCDVSFLPKIVSEFHPNQPLILPTLFLSPFTPLERMLRMLGVRCSLAFHINRTKSESLQGSSYAFMTLIRVFNFASNYLSLDCPNYLIGLSAHRQNTIWTFESSFYQSAVNLHYLPARNRTSSHLPCSYMV